MANVVGQQLLKRTWGSSSSNQVVGGVGEWLVTQIDDLKAMAKPFCFLFDIS